MFDKFMSPSSFPLDDYLPTWNYNEFAFRELAFAVLSLAAGRYRFNEPKKLEGDILEGYLIERNEEGLLETLPVLGSGCHSPGKESGSARLRRLQYIGSRMSSLA